MEVESTSEAHEVGAEIIVLSPEAVDVGLQQAVGDAVGWTKDM